MPQNYKLFTFFVAVTGTFSLVITGSLHSVFFIFIPLMFYGYLRLLKNKRQASKKVVEMASIAGLMIFIFDINFITVDYLIGVGHLSLIFHAIKSFDIKEPYDPLQVFFMSLLQLVIASEFTTKMLFGFILLIFIVAMLFAMVMAHFIKSGKSDVSFSELLKPVTLILFVTIMMSGVIFASVPRLRYGLWGKTHYKGIKNAGFTEEVKLSSGELKLDPSIVMRVEMNPLIRGPYYWRGATFDYFDGSTWINTGMNLRRNLPKTDDAFFVSFTQKTGFLQDIMLEPVDSDIVFGLDKIIMLKGDFYRVEMDDMGNLYLPKKGARRIHYIVMSSYDEGSTHMINKARFLQIPDGLKKTIKPFTYEILERYKGEDMDDIKKALLIERFLKENYRYSLRVDTEKHMNPVIDFLFYSKKGYCEHFATAMALMLRAQGIPSRLVTGFYGGQINNIGNYIIVRQMDAHSWVEAFVNGKWMRFEPTPSDINEKPPSPLFLYMDFLRMKWQRYVVGFTDEDRVRFFRLLSPSMPDIKIRLNPENMAIILSIPLMLFLIYLFYKKFILYLRVSPETYLYIRLKKLIERKGLIISPSSTPSDVLREGIRTGFYEGYLSEFISMYERWRFGGKKIDIKRYRKLFRYISGSRIHIKGEFHDKSRETL